MERAAQETGREEDVRVLTMESVRVDDWLCWQRHFWFCFVVVGGEGVHGRAALSYLQRRKQRARVLDSVLYYTVYSIWIQTAHAGLARWWLQKNKKNKKLAVAL